VQRKKGKLRFFCAPQGGAEAGLCSTRCGPFRAGRVPREHQDTSTSYDWNFMARRKTTPTKRYGCLPGLPVTASCALVLELRSLLLGRAWTGSYVGQACFCTGLLKMIVGLQLSSGNSAPNSGNNHHLSIPFEGGMLSFKRQGACVSRNWRYESEPSSKPSPLTTYKQFGTNSIIVLMFVESQRVHI